MTAPVAWRNDGFGCYGLYRREAAWWVFQSITTPRYEVVRVWPWSGFNSDSRKPIPIVRVV